MLALTLISAPSMRPFSVGLYNYIGKWAVQWNYLTAASIIGVVPIIILFILIEKQLVRGLTAGAIK